jgi:hypothetical protein
MTAWSWPELDEAQRALSDACRRRGRPIDTRALGPGLTEVRWPSGAETFGMSRDRANRTLGRLVAAPVP